MSTSGGRRGQELAPTTIRGYRSSAAVLQGLIEPATPLRRVNRAQIERVQAELLERGLQRWTVRHHMTALRSILDRGVVLGHLAASPFDDRHLTIVAQPKPSADFNVLEPSQVEAVARAIEHIADDEIPTYRASTRVDERALALKRATRAISADVVRLAAYTGLRFGELRALVWRDVDLLGETLLVQRNAPASAPAGSKVKAPKSTRARSVPIMDAAAVVLARVTDRREAKGLPTGPEDLVFSIAAGGRLQSGKVRDAFYRGLDNAGLGHLREKEDNPMTFRDLRHTFRHGRGARVRSRRGPGLHGPQRHRHEHAVCAPRPAARRSPSPVGGVRRGPGPAGPAAIGQAGEAVGIDRAANAWSIRTS